MFIGNDFGTDSHNAHTQPDGAYHYHGDPVAMAIPPGEPHQVLSDLLPMAFRSLVPISMTTVP